MLSLHAIPRGEGLRRRAWQSVHDTMFAGSCAVDLALHHLAPVRHRSGTVADGRLRALPDLALAEFAGPPERLGAAAGVLLGAPVRRLVHLMRRHPVVAGARDDRTVARMVAAIPDRHRAEIAALAAAARVPEATLALINAGIVDQACSAVARAPVGASPLMVGRNLDFFPAALLGRSTVLAVMRPPGRHAFASVGWPGSLGVVSGLNARGLSACILLNYDAVRGAEGAPLPFVARRALEECDDVAAALALFTAAPPASGHYLLLADAREAVVVWREGDGVRQQRLVDGWLACSNGGRDPGRCAPIDDRGRHLGRLMASSAAVDEAWMRRMTTATFLPGINVQAMVLVPALRRLQVATGDARRPAALNRWRSYDLADALAGGSIDAVEPIELGRACAAPHFLAA